MSLSADNLVTRADLDGAVRSLALRLDQHDQRFDGVEQRLDGVEKRLDGVGKRLDGVEQRLDGVEKRLDGVEKRLDGLDAKTDALDTKIDAVETRLSKHVSAEISRSLGVIEERFAYYFSLVMERLDHHCADARLHPALNDSPT